MEKVMNGNKYNPEESNLNQERQYNPNIQKPYDNPLKQGKSDEELELEDQNKDMDVEEEEEEENA